jgi:hypothetical protein
MIRLEEVKNIYGNTITRLKKSFKSGKQLLIKEGYKECINPFYVQKDNTFAHFDKVMKYWYFEEITDADLVYSMKLEWNRKYGKPIAVFSINGEVETVLTNT